MRGHRRWLGVLAVAGLTMLVPPELSGRVLATAVGMGTSASRVAYVVDAPRGQATHAITRARAQGEEIGGFLPLGGAVWLLALLFGVRAAKSRSCRELLFHVAVAFLSGAAASWAVRVGDGAASVQWLVMVVAAATLASIPWLVPSDVRRGFALRRLAVRARGPRRWRLLRALVVHRRIADHERDEAVRRRAERSVDAILDRGDRCGPESEAAVGRAVGRLVTLARRA